MLKQKINTKILVFDWNSAKVPLHPHTPYKVPHHQHSNKGLIPEVFKKCKHNTQKVKGLFLFKKKKGKRNGQ